MLMEITFDELRNCLTREGLYLFCGREYRGPVTSVALLSALEGKNVVVVDAGNMFDPYVVSRLCRVMRVDPAKVLSRFFIARGFTCHQVENLILGSLPDFVRQHRPSVVLVVGLLESFYDSEVPFREAEMLLKRTLKVLSGLSRKLPVLVVSPLPPLPAGERKVFFRVLALRASRIYGPCEEVEKGFCRRLSPRRFVFEKKEN